MAEEKVSNDNPYLDTQLMNELKLFNQTTLNERSTNNFNDNTTHTSCKQESPFTWNLEEICPNLAYTKCI